MGQLFEAVIGRKMHREGGCIFLVLFRCRLVLLHSLQIAAGASDASGAAAAVRCPCRLSLFSFFLFTSRRVFAELMFVLVLVVVFVCVDALNQPASRVPWSAFG